MGDSFYDMFLKEHEKYFPVHAMMQASAAKPKTPYQLDLETKDRKPSIVPKVGDMVKIKSREWYEKWKNENGNICDMGFYIFSSEMAKYCGKILEVAGNLSNDSFHLGITGYWWTTNMFEEVYPVQEQLSSKFPKINLNIPSLYQSPFEVKGSGQVLSKEEQERLLQRIRDTFEVKPKLKQVKTTHLLKLKKL